MRNPYQLLIVPLTLWSGFEQAFLTAEFTAVAIDYRTFVSGNSCFNPDNFST